MKTKKKVIIIILITALLLVGIGVVSFLACIGVFKGEKTEAEKVQEGFEDYFEVNSHVSDITSAYVESDGYIDESYVSNAVQAVGDYAKELFDNGEVKDYQVDDGESVWIQFDSGVEYVYTPPVEGVDSSAVSTYQPCLAMYDADVQDLSLECVDDSASNIENVLSDEYVFENNYDNEAASLDVLKDIGENEIVIWHGHGVYNTKIHSALVTSLKLDEEKFLLDPVYYIQNIGYTNDYLTGRIACTNSGYAVVTYKFFEKYLDNVDSSIIYLGACSSGKDDVLANTFLNKGANAVVGNTDTILTIYNLKNISSTFDNLATLSGEKYQNLNTALEKAKNSNENLYKELNEELYEEKGYTDEGKPKIFGNGDTRLSDKEVQTTAQPTTEQPTTAQPTTEAETNAQIPSDAVYNSSNGSSYKVFSGVIGDDMEGYEAYSFAEQYCESLGGHLATITSEEENSFIYSYLESEGLQSVHFGFSDYEEEGTWKWITGEAVTYTNWADGEPNNESGNEDYGIFYYKYSYEYSDGKWNDSPYRGDSVNLICEWDGTEQNISKATQTTTVEAGEYTSYFTNGSYHGTLIISNVTDSSFDFSLEVVGVTYHYGKVEGTANKISDTEYKFTDTQYPEYGFEETFTINSGSSITLSEKVNETVNGKANYGQNPYRGDRVYFEGTFEK